MTKTERLSIFLIYVAIFISMAGLYGCSSSGNGSGEGQPKIMPRDTVQGNIIVNYNDVIGIGPRYYGVEHGWVDQDNVLFLDRYTRLHGNAVRVQINQDFFEPVNDNSDPNFSEIDFSIPITIDSQAGTTMTYDSMFKALSAKFPDMYYQINVWLAARWNATDPNGYLGLGGAFPPIDYGEHREFIQALAQWLVVDCDIPPDHLSLTFINEPNLDYFFAGTQADLIQMANETRAALDQVSTSIQMGGLDEVHGTSWTDVFYSQKPASCCDMWIFHVYERGLPQMWNALYNRTGRLSQYGSVWVTEFADTTNGSPDGLMDFSSTEAALGFAYLLSKLWPSGIDGIIHFRLSDSYTDQFGLSGWLGHGLFADARGTHSNGQAYEPFPVYWVFANMYREFGGGEVVNTTAPDGLTVVSARKNIQSRERLAVYITNTSTASYEVSLSINNFPSASAYLQVFDNLNGDMPFEIKTLSDVNEVIMINMPPESSYLYCITSNQP